MAGAVQSAMPFTFNGIGTALRGYSSPISWTRPGRLGLGQKADHDAMECFVLLYVPLIPLRAVHTFAWTGNRYRVLPLRGAGRLLLNVYGRLLAMALAVGGLWGLLLAVTASISGERPLQQALPRVGVAVLICAMGFGLLRFLRSRDARTRDVRLVIGPHEAGSSDPALWSKEVLEKVKPVALSDAQASLQGGRYAQAMMRARIAAAQGDPEAERLTDEILAHPEIQAALPALRREPWRRGEILKA
jgi:hypothetical protein